MPLAPNLLMRTAGGLYLAVIALGLTAEFAIRMPLISADDPAATWAAISERLGLFRAGLLADCAMILTDIALAVLFFALLRRVQPEVALAAMVLRLMQAAIIAASLMASLGAVILVTDGPEAPETLLVFVKLHAMGYDLGLLFFGVNTLLTAWLFARAGLLPGWLPPLLAVAGAVYLLGSTTRLVAPALNALMQPAYLVTIVAELALAVTLLLARPAKPR